MCAEIVKASGLHKNIHVARNASRAQTLTMKCRALDEQGPNPLRIGRLLQPGVREIDGFVQSDRRGFGHALTLAVR